MLDRQKTTPAARRFFKVSWSMENKAVVVEALREGAAAGSPMCAIILDALGLPLIEALPSED